MTPAQKRRRIQTTKMRLRALADGSRLSHQPSAFARHCEMKRKFEQDKNGGKVFYRHRGRRPGVVRPSRMPGGCGYRGKQWLWVVENYRTVGWVPVNTRIQG